MQTKNLAEEFDVLAVVTISTVADEEHIIPAVDPTADLWFECVGHVSRTPTRHHFIVNDSFTECRGVRWYGPGTNNMEIPSGIVVTKNFDLVVSFEAIKTAFDAALPTSTLATQCQG